MVCEHVKEIRDVEPPTQGCAECLASGERWVQLRMCLTCGHVGCCDSSKGRHATAHWEATRHPVMRSIEPGQDWRWCYPHGDQLAGATSVGVAPGRTRDESSVAVHGVGRKRRHADCDVLGAVLARRAVADPFACRRVHGLPRLHVERAVARFTRSSPRNTTVYSSNEGV